MAHSVIRIGMILFLRRFYSIRRLLFNIYLFHDDDLIACAKYLETTFYGNVF